MDLPVRFPARVSQATDKFDAVNIVPDDRLAMVATAHDVVDGAFDSTLGLRGMPIA